MLSVGEGQNKRYNMVQLQIHTIKWGTIWWLPIQWKLCGNSENILCNYWGEKTLLNLVPILFHLCMASQHFPKQLPAQSLAQNSFFSDSGEHLRMAFCTHTCSEYKAAELGDFPITDPLILPDSCTAKIFLQLSALKWTPSLQSVVTGPWGIPADSFDTLHRRSGVLNRRTAVRIRTQTQSNLAKINILI